MPDYPKESHDINEPKVEYEALKGYRPTKGNLNPAKPPQGGSGVPPKQRSDTHKP